MLINPMTVIMSLLANFSDSNLDRLKCPYSMNTNQTTEMQEFFTETEWDMIYNFIGNALDNDDYDKEDVYTIRAKIHNLFYTDLTWTPMTRIEINRSIMEINNQKEVLQRQIDHLNQHIRFLAAQREQLQFDETPLFDQMFGG